VIDHARINALAKSKPITQAELARRVGLSQQAMFKIFSGQTKTSSSLSDIARELDTTTDYLTRKTDDPHGEAVLPELSYEQRQLLTYFDLLDDIDRQLVLTMVMRMADRGAPSRIQNPRLEYRAET